MGSEMVEMGFLLAQLRLGIARLFPHLYMDRGNWDLAGRMKQVIPLSHIK